MWRRIPTCLSLTVSLCCSLLGLGASAGAATQDAPAVAAPAASATTADTVTLDQWYVGELNGKKTASMHEVVVTHPDGTRTTTATMTMVIVRSLGTGETARSSRIDMSEVDAYDEDAAGRLVGFHFDQDESGQSSTAQGVILRDASHRPTSAHGTLLRLGRLQVINLPLNPDAQLLSDRELQERMGHATLAINDQIASDCVYLMDDRLRVGHTVATYLGLGAHARRTFSETTDLTGIPIRFSLDAQGELAKMTMDMGIFSFVFTPSPGPVPISGGEIGVGALIASTGPMPQTGASNRYRLPSTVTIVQDEFQHRQGDILTVTSATAPTPAPAASFLAPEAKLELDDPQLRQWVGQAVAGAAPGSLAAAQQLRMAVRSYLTGDLTTNNLSALEAFRAKHGDCTCHAALLCAALRIAGIPSRIEIGVVWAPELGSWAGHAWNSAYVDGHWVHLDSAYPGHPRSTYLKLASGNGEDAGASPITALAMLSGTTVETLSPNSP